jgi:hypothetical protein
MVQPVASHNPHQSTLRQLKWLVALLIFSNIGLGVFGFYVLRTIDRRYSELIGQSVPLQNNLQALTAQSVDAMRATGSNLFETSPAGRAEFIQHSRRSVETERKQRLQLLASYHISAAEKSRLECQRAGELFTRLAGQVLDVAESGRLDEAKRLRDAELRPAFDRYLAAITAAADELEAVSLRTNDEFSARTGSMSTVILGVASWPVIVFVGLLMVTAVFVIGLMILFRGREMGDAP